MNQTLSLKQNIRNFSGEPITLLFALVVGLPLLFMPFSSWLTISIAGLSMGAMLFVMASGMTLTFGLMGILNLGHGAFITLGAFLGCSVFLSIRGMLGDMSPMMDLAMIVPAILVAVLICGLFGYLFERVIIRPVYGDHLKQILVTVGGAIVIEQLIQVFWGPNEIPLPRPDLLRGSIVIGDIAIQKYRLLAVAVGLLIYWGLQRVIQRTRIGLLIRAGVENSEMVEALGYRINTIFIMVFLAGSSLAGVGGVMWGLYDEIITAQLGEKLLVQVIIVIIIGGLGSIRGCLLAALLVGLLGNYMSYMAPNAALFSSIGLMMAVLMWRPQGLIPVIKG